MLLPFIPLLLALAGITVIGLLPAAAATAPQGAELALRYVVLFIPALVLGNLPESWLGSRSPMRFSRRRMVLLGLWIMLVSGSTLVNGWMEAFAGIDHGEELAVVVLLLNFWICDALALQPFNPLRVKALPAQAVRLAENLAIGLPVVLLVAAGLVVSALGALLPGLGDAAALLPPWLAPLGALAIYVGVAGLVIPVLIPLCWRLRTLEDANVEGIIRHELAANGVSVARVLNWPAEMTGHATAGVIGILPRFRYLLFADVLARALTAEEIRSVTAHEAAHIRRRHLWYFIAAILAYILIIHFLLQALALAGLWLEYTIPFWAMTLIEIGGLLLFLRFGLGFLSRNFERQADGNALRRSGIEPFRTALLKIARLNRIAPEADNWHHYGIARRLAFLEGAEQAPETLDRHDRWVARIKVVCVAVLVCGMVAQAVFSEAGVVTYLIKQHWINGLEQVAEPSQAQLEGLNYLALQAFERKDFSTAERYFRRLMEVNPEDPSIQNNLAWLLVTRPGAETGHLQEGLRLARMASRASESAFIWDTLAEAYFRTNHLAKSKSAAERALGLAKAGRGRGNTPLAYYRGRLADFGRAGKRENNPTR